MRKPLLRIYNYIGRRYLSPILRAEQKKRPFPEINERAAEYAFALRYLKTFGSGPVLDIGPGRSSWPHLLTICGFAVRAIDSKEGYWKGYINRHFLVEKDDIRNPRITGPFQFITCISTLEHIPETSQAMKGMSALLAPGGYLVLTFPYNEKHYGIAHSEKLTQVFSRRELDHWLTENPELKIVKQEYYRLFEGQTWLQGRSLKHPIRTYRTQPHHLSCLLIRKTHR
jgi:SAM-dependent methyltransferase